MPALPCSHVAVEPIFFGTLRRVRVYDDIDTVATHDVIQQASSIARAPVVIVIITATVKPALENRMETAEIHFDKSIIAAWLTRDIPGEERSAGDRVRQAIEHALHDCVGLVAFSGYAAAGVAPESQVLNHRIFKAMNTVLLSDRNLLLNDDLFAGELRGRGLMLRRVAKYIVDR